jgi:hypothetical protein
MRFATGKRAGSGSKSPTKSCPKRNKWTEILEFSFDIWLVGDFRFVMSFKEIHHV